MLNERASLFPTTTASTVGHTTNTTSTTTTTTTSIYLCFFPLLGSNGVRFVSRAAKAPGSLVAMQAAHLAARKTREKEEADLEAKKATRSSREH